MPPKVTYTPAQVPSGSCSRRLCHTSFFAALPCSSCRNLASALASGSGVELYDADAAHRMASGFGGPPRTELLSQRVPDRLITLGLGVGTLSASLAVILGLAHTIVGESSQRT